MRITKLPVLLGSYRKKVAAYLTDSIILRVLDLCVDPKEQCVINSIATDVCFAVNRINTEMYTTR